MNGIVDRFEGNIVVIEVDEKMYEVDSKFTDGNLKEGDVVELVLQNNKIIKVIKKEDETRERKEYMENLLKDMWQ